MHFGNPFNLATKPSKQMTPTRLFILTLLAMIAFASNSLFCRAALKQTGIDAASFTFIRIFSGAVALWLIATMRHGRPVAAVYDRRILGGNWLSALALFAYAAAFSFAYVSLSAGTGALLLFAAVQATMIVWGLRRGERLGVRQLVGLTLALIGLVALFFPGLSAPSLSGAILMLGAGVAWGIYSLRGKAAGDAITATTGNFLRAVPLAVVLIIPFLPSTHVDRAGIGYAVLSGAIASGVGYVIWYSALGGLESSQRRHSSVERASARGHWRNPLARRTDHFSLSSRVDRRVRRHRSRRNRKESIRQSERYDLVGGAMIRPEKFSVESQ
jgi:drug/metabolite transporter (DMT)-like permease